MVRKLIYNITIERMEKVKCDWCEHKWELQKLWWIKEDEYVNICQYCID